MLQSPSNTKHTNNLIHSALLPLWLSLLFCVLFRRFIHHHIIIIIIIVIIIIIIFFFFSSLLSFFLSSLSSRLPNPSASCHFAAAGGGRRRTRPARHQGAATYTAEALDGVAGLGRGHGGHWRLLGPARTTKVRKNKIRRRAEGRKEAAGGEMRAWEARVAMKFCGMAAMAGAAARAAAPGSPTAMPSYPRAEMFGRGGFFRFLSGWVVVSLCPGAETVIDGTSDPQESN